MAGPNLYRGIEGLTRLVKEWTENYDDYRSDPWGVRCAEWTTS